MLPTEFPPKHHKFHFKSLSALLSNILHLLNNLHPLKKKNFSLRVNVEMHQSLHTKNLSVSYVKHAP